MILAKAKPFEGASFSRRNHLARMLWQAVWFFLFRPSPQPMHAWRCWLLRRFGAKIAISSQNSPKCAQYCAEMHQKRVQITPNVRRNDPTTSLKHFGSSQKNRDFCSKYTSRTAWRSPKQPPRNATIAHFLHKIHQKARCIAPGGARNASRSHQMSVGVFLQHP